MMHLCLAFITTMGLKFSKTLKFEFKLLLFSLYTFILLIALKPFLVHFNYNNSSSL